MGLRAAKLTPLFAGIALIIASQCGPAVAKTRPMPSSPTKQSSTATRDFYEEGYRVGAMKGAAAAMTGGAMPAESALRIIAMRAAAQATDSGGKELWADGFYDGYLSTFQKVKKPAY